MELEKKHYYQILVCVLISVICVVLYAWYYMEYIKPKSNTIGSPETELAYTRLPIKDYISTDSVLFSMDVNDVSFKVENGTATYNYTFDSQQYNGLITDYALFVNNTLLSDSQNAGTLSGVYTLNYINENNTVFNTTNINISFTFHSLSSQLRISFADTNDNLGLLMNYFKNNSFIITVCENPFTMGQVQTDDELGRIDCKVFVGDATNVYAEYNDSLLTTNSSKTILVKRSGSMSLFTVVTNDIKDINVVTNGEYTVDYDPESYEYTITWSNADYLFINVNTSNTEVA